MKGITLLVLAAALITTGCATLGEGIANRNVEKAIELINARDAGALTLHSGKPFIFEGEALFRPVDTEAVWRNLAENGFFLENPVVTSVGKVDSTTYMIFSDSKEMEILFRKYIPEKSTLAAVETAGGTYHLLLGSGTGGYPSILGITGF